MNQMSSKYFIPFIHFLFWSMLLLLPLFLMPGHNLPTAGTDMPDQAFTISNLFHLVLFYFNAWYLYPRLINKRRWGIYIFCLVVLIAVSYYIKLFLIQWWYPSFTVTTDTWRYIFFPTIVFLMISIIYRMVVDKINHDHNEKMKKAERLATELQFLRSQISPHFLFNMLANLVSLARKKSDLLEPSLIKLSELVRYMLYESDKERSLLSREAEYLEGFVELQQLRFGDVPVDLCIEINDSLCTIEPMLLIPFVENAFKHGVGMIKDPFIRIHLSVTGNQLLFRSVNKYNPGEKSKDHNSGIGLQNVSARLQLLYPGRHLLTIQDANDIYDVQLKIELQC